jgi:hypothetical protein
MYFGKGGAWVERLRRRIPRIEGLETLLIQVPFLVFLLYTSEENFDLTISCETQRIRKLPVSVWKLAEFVLLTAAVTAYALSGMLTLIMTKHCQDLETVLRKVISISR